MRQQRGGERERKKIISQKNGISKKMHADGIIIKYTRKPP
jgi:hypothetical protein